MAGDANIPNGVAFLVAAAAAPALTFVVFVGSSVFTETQAALGAGGVGIVLFMSFAFSLFAIGLGLAGSAILMGAAFGLLALIHREVERRPFHYVLAGLAAGLTHLAIAYVGTRLTLPGALTFVLGTWFTHGGLQAGKTAAVVGPPLAGAGAGLIYVLLRFPSARRWLRPRA